MKRLVLLFAVLFLWTLPAFPQTTAAPPATLVNSDPKAWKEYSFENDNVRFRFPSEPKIETATIDTSSGPMPARIYGHESILSMRLMVVERPSGGNLEEQLIIHPDLLDSMVAEILLRVKDSAPKIRQRENIMVGEHPGRSVRFETSDGVVSRLKLSVVKNREYYAWAEAQRSDLSGVNGYQYFEIWSTAFLDSIGLIRNPATPSKEVARLNLQGNAVGLLRAEVEGVSVRRGNDRLNKAHNSLQCYFDCPGDKTLGVISFGTG